MIAIDNVLLSDQLIEENFVCDLQKCKGGCCVDGDCGAPLTEEETVLLKEIYPTIKPFLNEEYIKVIDEVGTHTIDNEYGFVTPAVNGGICAYGYTDEMGIVKCGIEKAYYAGAISFKKPISCHLYPIRVTSYPEYELVNYEPRKPMCRPACKLGNKLKVPVYQFLKEPIIRRFGEEFYNTLDDVARLLPDHLNK